MQTHRHTDDLKWASSTCLMNPMEYRNFSRSNRYTSFVDYAIFNHNEARGLWTIKFKTNISLTQFTMMLGLIEYR